MTLAIRQAASMGRAQSARPVISTTSTIPVSGAAASVELAYDTGIR